jgi:hypothetical protein
MERFYCQCGTEIFFENSHCAVCIKQWGFDPEQCQMQPLDADVINDGWHSQANGLHYRFCSHRQDLTCNWLIPDYQHDQQCLSCRMTRTIPTLSIPRNQVRWRRLEQTKRRALYTILRLRLPLNQSDGQSTATNDVATGLPPLIFDFLEDQQSNPDVLLEFVYSGHSNGIITVNAAEADDSFRAANRELMNEVYRTLLGHFRHELGHYYGLLINHNPEVQNEYRKLFGDDTLDYKTALEQYYEKGASDDWRKNYISAYASSHPQEDWAESWAHYLHIHDTLETARCYEIIPVIEGGSNFGQNLNAWAKLSVVMNALNRSMGLEDAYPFVINTVTGQKLEFIDRLVKAWQVSGHNVARQ